MGKAVLILTLALSIAGASVVGAQPADETGIRCTLSPATTDASMYLVRQIFLSTSSRPSQIQDMPQGISANPKYFLVNIAGANIPLVLASWQNMDKAVLYVDTNGDGRLSDEKGYPCPAAKRNDVLVAEPKFRIVNEAEKVIASGQFEYG
jgi:hypothetical protein